MHIEAKILHKTVDQIHQYIKRIMNHDQVGLMPEMQGGFSIYRSTSIIHHVHRIKEKNHGIISLERGSTFVNTQYSLKIEVFSKLEIGENFLNLRRASKKKNICLTYLIVK